MTKVAFVDRLYLLEDMWSLLPGVVYRGSFIECFATGRLSV